MSQRLIYYGDVLEREVRTMMDPTTALRELREAIEQFSTSHNRAIEIADRFTELDDYLSRGGDLPAQWSKAR